MKNKKFDVRNYRSKTGPQDRKLRDEKQTTAIDIHTGIETLQEFLRTQPKGQETALWKKQRLAVDGCPENMKLQLALANKIRRVASTRHAKLMSDRNVKPGLG